MTACLFAPRDFLPHIVDNAHVIAGGRLPNGARLHPLVHLLEGPAQQRRLGLPVPLYKREQTVHVLSD